jgi:hypothetical protein
MCSNQSNGKQAEVVDHDGFVQDVPDEPMEDATSAATVDYPDVFGAASVSETKTSFSDTARAETQVHQQTADKVEQREQSHDEKRPEFDPKAYEHKPNLKYKDSWLTVGQIDQSIDAYLKQHMGFSHFNPIKGQTQLASPLNDDDQVTNCNTAERPDDVSERCAMPTCLLLTKPFATLKSIQSILGDVMFEHCWMPEHDELSNIKGHLLFWIRKGLYFDLDLTNPARPLYHLLPSYASRVDAVLQSVNDMILKSVRKGIRNIYITELYCPNYLAYGTEAIPILQSHWEAKGYDLHFAGMGSGSSVTIRPIASSSSSSSVSSSSS